MKHLQKYPKHLKIIAKYIQHPDKTLATYISLKTSETFEYTLETCVYSHSNICNIKMKHLKHTSETLEKNT